MQDGNEQLDITSKIIACFLRHLSEHSAIKTLQSIIKHQDKIIGVGLDSSELGHPPEKFKRALQQAKDAGLLTAAHTGEDGPVQNIVDLLRKGVAVTINLDDPAYFGGYMTDIPRDFKMQDSERCH